MKKFIFSIFIIVNLFSSNVLSEIEIRYKVGNIIITNFDIEKEIKYLTSLNNSILNLNDKQVLDIATDSIIREKIKFLELKKYFEFEGENEYLKKIFNDYMQRFNFNNDIELEKYFQKFDISKNEILAKIEIETLWNQLIFQKYNSQVKIDEIILKEKLIKRKKNLKIKEINVSEIVFQPTAGKKIDEKINEIKKSIQKVGFENTANIYSIADSKSFGGNIGWVNQDNLSDQIVSKIKNLKENDVSEFINIGGNYIVLKINQIRENTENINEKEELKKIEIFERDKQLNKFSMIYFNKIKINTNVKRF
ncbi:peptidylprolyl isomerase [Candidatus Pelagibacter sp.]|uniref:peptidylprolyl isomerase n=1 Tax=Candidatus Pelagibacter sp. TaxID=2024849 RepID=UPI003F8328C9